MGNLVIKINREKFQIENESPSQLTPEIVDKIKHFIQTGDQMNKRLKQKLSDIEGTIVAPELLKIRYDLRTKRIALTQT